MKSSICLKTRVDYLTFLFQFTKLTLVFAEVDDQSLFKKTYGERKLSELLVLNKVEIEGDSKTTTRSNYPSRKASAKSEITTNTPLRTIGPTKRSLEALTKNMAFLIKFSSIIAENSAVQFAVLMHVAIGHQGLGNHRQADGIETKPLHAAL